MLHDKAPCLAVSLALLAFGCGGGQSDEEPVAAAATDDPTLVVYVVNYPLAYFAERIGGDTVRVEFPAPSGLDPALWSPDADTVAAYQAADLILLNGAGYAKWVDRVTLPESKLVNTSGAVEDRFIVVEDAATHTHGPEGEHSHADKAFTTWLDPTLAIEQARAIREAFAEARPARAEEFRLGFEELERDLLELDEGIRALVAGSDRPLVASHPVYEYLARRYGLQLRSVHFEPDEFPDQASWRDLELLLDEHPAKWMLWEGDPLDETKQRLLDLGIKSVVYDPCGNLPESRDFRSVMLDNVRNLGLIFGHGGVES